MPLFDYRCPGGHTQEEWRHLREEFPEEMTCKTCGESAKRLIGLPRFRTPDLDEYGNEYLPADTDIFAGTGMDGFDGINETMYESDKIQVDLGK